MSIARRLAELETAAALPRIGTDRDVTQDEFCAGDEGRQIMADLDALIATGAHPSIVRLRERFPDGWRSVTERATWLSLVADDPTGLGLLRAMSTKQKEILAARGVDTSPRR